MFHCLFNDVPRVSGRPEKGSALPLMLVVVVLSCLSVFGVSRLGRGSLVKGQAQIAADAAALAGARAGLGEARHFSASNGADLVSFSPTSTPDWVEVDVVVQHHGVFATASARYVPPTTLPPTTLPPTTTTTVPTTTVPTTTVPTTSAAVNRPR